MQTLIDVSVDHHNSSGFGGKQSSSFGTTSESCVNQQHHEAPLYFPTREDIHSISAYIDKSHEELKWQTYQQICNKGSNGFTKGFEFTGQTMNIGQHGISSLPVSNSNNRRRRKFKRHVASRHPRLPSQRPTCQTKVPFFIHEIDKPAPVAPSLPHSNSKGDEDNQKADILARMPKLPEGGSYYTEPSVTELVEKELAEPGWCTRVKDFVVGRREYGYITLVGETDVRNLDLESIVQFNHGEVILRSCQINKATLGQSLNLAEAKTTIKLSCVTKAAPSYFPTIEDSNSIHSISAMPAYLDKCHEELRWQTYQSRNKGSQAVESCVTKQPSYVATRDEDYPGSRIQSISAMPVYLDKSHEQLRWQTYQSRNKGSQAVESCVTKQPSYVATRDKDSPGSLIQSISAMPAYLDKSHEQLRWQSYQSRNKGDPNKTPNIFTSPSSIFNHNTPFPSNLPPLRWQSTNKASNGFTKGFEFSSQTMNGISSLPVPFFINEVDKPVPIASSINNSLPLHSHSNSKGNEDKQKADILATMPKLGSYYTEPSVTELAAKEIAEPGWCTRVKDFVMGRRGYGSIKLLGETDVRNLDVESIVQFNDREVNVRGVDNKPCEVTLLNVKCIGKKAGKQYVSGPQLERYKEKLMKREGTEFVSYDPLQGEWKFRLSSKQ